VSHFGAKDLLAIPLDGYRSEEVVIFGYNFKELS
jgi:hypothetical protein